MNFFQQLAAISTGLDVTLRIKQKSGKLTLSVLTETTDNTGIQPLLLNGTPEELDAEFFNLISKPVAESTATLINLAEHKASVAAAVEDEKPVAKAKAEKPKAAAPAKEVKKIAAPAAAPDLFAEAENVETKVAEVEPEAEEPEEKEDE